MVTECRPPRRAWWGIFGGKTGQAPVAESATNNRYYEEQFAALQHSVHELALEVRRLSLRNELGLVCNEEPQIRSLFKQLAEQELERDTCLSLIKKVADELSREAIADYRVVRERAVAHLSHLAACQGPLQPVSGQCTVLFLVGPTGVGKTTTIAKLAAQLAVIEQRRVLLACADDYRVGAEAQLQTYASIMGVPLAVVPTGGELRDVVQRHKAMDFILVDMPGYSQRNRDGLAEAKSLIEAVPRQQRQVHLAISASTRLSELRDMVGAFLQLGVSAIVATKLDETLHFGPLLSVLASSGKPLSYLTTGQRVPEDLEVATPTRLAELVLRGY